MKTAKKWIRLGTVVSICIAGLAISSSAFASDDMSGAFGNTLQMETEIGPVNLYFEPDGTYTNDQNGSGTWTLVDGELCLAGQGALPNCRSFEGGHVPGEEWFVQSNGGVQVYRMIQGR